MMHTEPRAMTSEMRLYDRRKRRLYINAAERARFIAAARGADPHVGSFCMVLLHTGCRISEALELTPASLQLRARVISFRTLKKRHRHEMREVPIPAVLADLLAATHGIGGAGTPSGEPLWRHRGRALNRSTGYRWIKAVMAEAGIEGAQASPKGLRHGYGVHAIRRSVPLNMLSKWMGHAALSTTAIYTNASGREEQEIAERMWD
ncbi:tyrosine-type recombinase/integrase [Minwuia sp.]|uniref:tyrosine-type recombinase/integrase n=1 Tax=Minwuia sp. TaxID=2493630 RepID=UPI003A958315